MEYSIYKKPYGKLLLSDGGDLIENYVKFENKLWDEEVIQEIEKYINNQSVIIDVGSYIGEQIIHLAKKVKHIHAFEPQIRRFNQMCGNFCINECDNVTSYNYTCWKYNGYATINTPTGSNLGDTRCGESTQPTQIKMLALDSLNLDVNLIKIDAQGTDYYVIEGARETIMRCRPIVIFEYENFSPKSVEDFCKLFEDMGYTMSLVKENHPDYIAKPK